MKRLRNALLLLASLTLLFLILAPQTRWLAAMQVGASLHLCHPFNRIFNDFNSPNPASYTGVPSLDKKRVQTVLRHHADDLPMQMAFGLPFSSATTDARANLRALIPRSPKSPSLYANLLRCESFPTIRLNRPEIDALNGEKTEDHSFEHVSTPQELALYDQEAAAGERIDPANAYFPFMRSVGLFAAHRDAEGLAAIQRASSEPLWKEYYFDESEGHRHLYQEAFGDKSAINQAAFSAAILMPHYMNLQHTAYFAVSQAIKAEQGGDVSRGIAIRQRLTHIAKLMRVQSSTLIGTEIGITVAKIATLKLGAEPLQRENNEIGKDSGSAARIDLYCRYLSQTNHPAAAREARAEYAAGQTVRHMLSFDVNHGRWGGSPNFVVERGPCGQPLRHLIVWWEAGLCLLSNLIWTLILGWLAARLARTRLLIKGEPLPRRFQPVAFFLFLAGAAAIGFAAYWQSDTLKDLWTALISLDDSDVPSFLTWPLAISAAFCLCGFLAVPSLMLIVLTLASLIRRVPLAAGIVRGFQAAALPIACFLALIYGGLVWVTTKQEKVITHNLEQVQQGAGPYYAALVGQKWPE